MKCYRRTWSAFLGVTKTNSHYLLGALKSWTSVMLFIYPFNMVKRTIADAIKDCLWPPFAKRYIVARRKKPREKKVKDYTAASISAPFTWIILSMLSTSLHQAFMFLVRLEICNKHDQKDTLAFSNCPVCSLQSAVAGCSRTGTAPAPC